MKTMIDFKRWKMDEAERCGVTMNAIQARVLRGKYPKLKLIREGRNTIFVNCENRFVPPSGQKPNEIKPLASLKINENTCCITQQLGYDVDR